MNDKLHTLLKQRHHLLYNYGGCSKEYWLFPKENIESNDVLYSFLLQNQDLKASDILLEGQEISQNQVIEDFIFKDDGKNYLVHDSVRDIIYFFGFKKLENYLILYRNNVIQEKLKELLPGKFYYDINLMNEVENKIFDGVALKEVIKTLINLNNNIHRPAYQGYVIDINNLDRIIRKAKEDYNFEVLKF